MKKSVYRVLLLTFFLSLGFAHEIYLRRAPVPTYEEYQEEVAKKKAKKNKWRSLASTGKPKVAEAPQYSPPKTPEPERKDPEPFYEKESPTTVSTETPVSGMVGYYSQAPSNAPRPRNERSSSSRKSSSESNSTSSGSGDGKQISTIGGGIICPGDPSCPSSTSDSTNDDSNIGDTQETASAPQTLTCSADIGGGNFGNPISVGLSCSRSATIKYCLQEGGGCCEPNASSPTYSSPIVIGSTNGDFCLKFYGQSSSSTSSTLAEAYNINSSFPDLTVTHTKTYYQTTQLTAKHDINSNDFGETNFWLGQINLKSHDPGISGLNLTCDEIVQNHSTLTSPTPQEMFTPMDMALMTPADTVEVPLDTSQLAYGDNFITSYILNDNYASPLYSCSTNKIILEDFDFFAVESCHGDAGTNEVREFSGAFSPYGFFEQASVMPRAPAGSATEEQNTQELRVGSFAVFY